MPIPLRRTNLTVHCKLPRRETHGYCAVGAWGNLCQANLPYEGQTAAHGQITERNYSVAQIRFFLAGDSLPIQDEPEGRL